MSKDSVKDVTEASVECLSVDSSNDLSDTFYTSQKKNHVFRVSLASSGFKLQRESPSGTKEQIVKIVDIVGGRCMRLKKKKSSRRLTKACACTTTASTTNVTSDRTPKGSVNSNAAKEETDDVYGDSDCSAYLYVFAYVIKKSLRSNLHRERMLLLLRFRSFDIFEDNMREADRWYRALRWHVNRTLEDIFYVPEDERRRRILVLLNPKSGCGKAREMFNLQMTPVLNEAEVPYDLHVTKHSNYALEYVSTRNLDVWCCIVAVGGDGLFHEILNGLLQREDWRLVLQRTALGIVPCGSGNGLARSIAHSFNEPYGSKPILGSVLTTISGKTAPMDVVRVELQHSKPLYSFLSIGWGLISDIDIESERLRILGYQRFTLWTLHRLVSLRTYRGRVTYLPKCNASEHATKDAQNVPKSSLLRHSCSCTTHIDKLGYNNCFQSTEHIPHNEFEDVISLETSMNQSFRSRCDSWLSSGSRRSYYYSISESLYHSLADESDWEEDSLERKNKTKETFGPQSTMPPLSEPLPQELGWCVEEGDFIMMHAAYQTHLGIDCFFAPKAELNDGTIYLIIIRGGISRPQLFNFLINMSSGTHLPTKNGEYIKVIPVTAFRLEPFDNHGILTVDGERVEFGSLQAEVLPGIARVMVPK